eukprot:826919-Amphidinium_carterae.1
MWSGHLLTPATSQCPNSEHPDSNSACTRSQGSMLTCMRWGQPLVSAMPLPLEGMSSHYATNMVLTSKTAGMQYKCVNVRARPQLPPPPGGWGGRTGRTLSCIWPRVEGDMPGHPGLHNSRYSVLAPHRQQHAREVS